MKKLHEVVTPDQAIFNSYTKGEEVTISALVSQDYMKDFEAGNSVEVFFKANSPSQPHFLGSIVKNNGVVPTIPKGQPEAVSITVKRI